MIISQKCNCCARDKICAFKDEYLAACETGKTATYEKGEHGFMFVKDSSVDVHINCPHMMSKPDSRSSSQLSKLF